MSLRRGAACIGELMITRRELMQTGAAVAGVAAVAPAIAARKAHAAAPRAAPPQKPGLPGRDYTPTVTPNGSTLPFTVKGDVKVMHLVAEVVKHEFAPGLEAECWGYNGGTPGPTIELVEGDRVRIYVTNKLPEPTTVHWHGVILENGMDGVAGLTQPPIQPGETYRYDFTARHPGTFMYHPHFDEMVQMALGMQGMFIVHPRRPTRKVDRDYVIMLSEWKIEPGARRPDALAMMDFNVLTMNSKAFPGTAPLVARTGDRVRVRLGNLSAMDHHPIHLHGFAFETTATDGGPIRESARIPDTTVLVPVGGTRDIEWVADNPGDWAMHCHMTHHIMNQMGHDLPNMIGVDTKGLARSVNAVQPHTMLMGQTGMGGMGEMKMPVPPNSLPMRGAPGPFSYIDMGGMFTIVKVRDVVDESTAAGWYQHPAGTVARRATPQEMKEDLG
jgi:manganese oxidase